jgi:hypothetical protein
MCVVGKSFCALYIGLQTPRQKSVERKYDIIYSTLCSESKVLLQVIWFVP